MKLTPTQLLILRQAVTDGGEVVLSGLDAHAGWNKRHRTAAKALHCAGLGSYLPDQGVGSMAAGFAINEAGRLALQGSAGE